MRAISAAQERWLGLTHYCSSYMNLALCAVVATFQQTANVAFPSIWIALHAISDDGTKCCLDTILNGHSKCMIHVKNMQIPAQILHAQSWCL